MTLVITSLAAIRLQDARTSIVAAFMGVLARFKLFPSPRVRHAAAHWRRGVTYVHAVGKTAAGVRTHMPPVQRRETSATYAEVGAAVRESLAAYRERVRFPHARSQADKTRYQDFLGLLDAKTNAEMMKGGKLVSIQSTPDAIRFTPRRNEGARRGFSGLPPEADLELPAAASLDDLGRALAEAFARCA
jgi:hypothetical protein